jgi:hypothetical protein
VLEDKEMTMVSSKSRNTDTWNNQLLSSLF